jgi:hypothetical protein
MQSCEVLTACTVDSSSVRCSLPALWTVAWRSVAGIHHTDSTDPLVLDELLQELCHLRE